MRIGKRISTSTTKKNSGSGGRNKKDKTNNKKSNNKNKNRNTKSTNKEEKDDEYYDTLYDSNKPLRAPSTIEMSIRQRRLKNIKEDTIQPFERPVGTALSNDIILSILVPKIEQIAISQLENYTDQLVQYYYYQKQQEQQQQQQEPERSITTPNKNDDTSTVVIVNADGTTTTTTSSTSSTSAGTTVPPMKPLLFYSEHAVYDFIDTVFYDTSNYFFTCSTQRKTSLSSLDHYNNNNYCWRVPLNGAKFERLLDEQYGIFRPLITKYPQLDIYLKSFQRKYATGYFSPFRQSVSSFPLSKSNCIILLFMIHRGGGSKKIHWTASILLLLFLFVGLQPWALVVCILVYNTIQRSYKYRTVSTMSSKIPSTKPYYHYANDDDGVEEKEVSQQQQHTTPTPGNDNNNTNSHNQPIIDRYTKHKYDILNQPVGTPLLSSSSNPSSIIDTSDYDTILIGSELGTLYTGALLARAGRKIIVLCPTDDASGCVILDPKIPAPFDIENCNITKISRQQQLLVPALLTENDYQGGIRFAQIGTPDDGYTYEIFDIPGLVDHAAASSSAVSDNGFPFILSTAGGIGTLMEQTALYFGDGYPNTMLNEDGDSFVASSSSSSTDPTSTIDTIIGQSSTGAYIKACETINASSGAYYLSKLVPSVDDIDAETNMNYINKLIRNLYYGEKKNNGSSTSSTGGGQYGECAIRSTSHFLLNVFPNNRYLRSLMAAIGMKNENIEPVSTSMGAHVTNLCATLSGEGMFYPIGGPRALGHAFQTVIEQNGGCILTSVPIQELRFDETLKSPPATTTTTSSSTSDIDDKQPQPYCVGITLKDGRTIQFDKLRYGTSKQPKNKQPVVISMEGFIGTYIYLLPDNIRNQYKVPKGLPALCERRPVFYVLYYFRGTAADYNIVGGADYYRLPAAASIATAPPQQQPPAPTTNDPTTDGTAADTTTTTTDPKNGTTDPSPTDDDDNKENHQVQTPVAAAPPAATPVPVQSSAAPSTTTNSNNKTKKEKNKFQPGYSWMHIAFPSAKDPSFEVRYGPYTQCVITIEADDNFVTEFETTKPQLFVRKPTTAGATTGAKSISSTTQAITTLLENVTNDFYNIYPQFAKKGGGKNNKLIASKICGPYPKGLKHTPERYVAKGIHPKSSYPGLFVGGTDLTVDSMAGSFVAGWMVANCVQQYQPIDHILLHKNITTDIEHFISPPITTEEEEDVAVPLPPPPPSQTESNVEATTEDEGAEPTNA